MTNVCARRSPVPQGNWDALENKDAGLGVSTGDKRNINGGESCNGVAGKEGACLDANTHENVTSHVKSQYDTCVEVFNLASRRPSENSRSELEPSLSVPVVAEKLTHAWADVSFTTYDCELGAVPPPPVDLEWWGQTAAEASCGGHQAAPTNSDVGRKKKKKNIKRDQSRLAQWKQKVGIQSGAEPAPADALPAATLGPDGEADSAMAGDHVVPTSPATQRSTYPQKVAEWWTPGGQRYTTVASVEAIAENGPIDTTASSDVDAAARRVKTLQDTFLVDQANAFSPADVDGLLVTFKNDLDDVWRFVSQSRSVNQHYVKDLGQL